MGLYKVNFSARSGGSGFIPQSIVVSAASAEAARDKVGGILSSQCARGAWFIDWRIGSAELVG
jgi:hypothetical protein